MKFENTLYENICSIFGGNIIGSYRFLNKGLSLDDINDIDITIDKEKYNMVIEFLRINGYRRKGSVNYYTDKMEYSDSIFRKDNYKSIHIIFTDKGITKTEKDILKFKIERFSERDKKQLLKIIPMLNF